MSRMPLAVALVLALLLGVMPQLGVAQTLSTGAEAFEAAYLFIIQEHLRPAPSRELLQGAVAGLAAYLRGRGLLPQTIVLKGPETQDLVTVRDAIAGAGRRLGTAASARDAGYAAIDGMVQVLGDPHTRLVLPTQGRSAPPPAGYSGVGVVLDLTVHPPVVTQVLDGSPAHRAGLRTGDIVMEIDGRPTVGMPPQEVATRLRGLPGTTVVVRLRRGPADVVVTLVREIIGLQQTSFRRIGGVGYVRLAEFDGGAAEEVTAVVAELHRQGVRGIILDLRRNPGGYLDETVAVASIFLSQGLVATLVIRTGERTRLSATPGGFKFSGPVAVLVDRQTASAAEMLAGALQDAGHAVVGVRTFGKGTAQVIRRLPGGAVLQLTVAQYLTPNGTVVDGRGIQPLIEAEAEEGTVGTDEDRVLLAALQWLEPRLGSLIRRAA